MQQPTLKSQKPKATSRKPISFWYKLLFSSGDWGLASTNIMRSVFYSIFLTDVMGLEPRLASFAVPIGIGWDAINDPIVGMISDRVRTRWGRRRPFLLFFAIPFGLSFVALWNAPQWESQWALVAYVTLAYILADTFYTLIAVPLYSLTPEIFPDYDERTTIMGLRSFFQFAASIITIVAAPAIVDAALASGLTSQQGYLIVSTLFGALAVIPFLVIFFIVRERATPEQEESLPLGKTLAKAWSNVPFRFAAGMFMFNWSAADVVALTFPYFLLYWVEQGDVFSKASVFGMNISLESAFFGLLMLVSIVALPFWTWFAQKIDKRVAYITAMIFWAGVQFSIWFIQPGQIAFLMFVAGLAGIGISAAYVLPDAMFADIIEWDELLTGRRQEGIYFGARAFIRKTAGGIAIFSALQLLGWAGYQTPPDNVTLFMQPDGALLVIRLLVSVFGGVLLLGAVVMAWLYPLTRKKHDRILRILEKRQERQKA
jgi:GPH family glycoside/pentoside/hexuronide:cation symporter